MNPDMNDAVMDNYRLIVVDDEPIVHQMMKRIVDESGLPISIAGFACSAKQALEMVRVIRPHICLLDIQMAEMNGLELAVQMNDVLDYQPVIVYVTAHRVFEYAQQAIKLGAVDYLVKPIRRDNVLETLGKVVSHLQADRLEQIEKDRLKQSLQSVLPGAVSVTGPSAETRRACVVKAAREYIEKHYPEDITLSDVADHLNLSAGHLGTMFKAEYGIPFKAYLRRVRIARAKDYMQDPKLNLSEIAQRVGYEDISYFSHSFLEETGVRPSEYRGEGRRWPKSH